MEDNFTDEEIQKALEQADANMAFEEVDLLAIKKGKVRTLRIDNNDKSSRR